MTDGLDPAKRAELEYKARLDSALEQYKGHIAWQAKSFEATIAYGQSAVRGALLINGAGAIALIGFLGRTGATAGTGKGDPGTAMQAFIVGIVCSVMAAAASYLSQSAYTAAGAWHDGSRKRKLWNRVGTAFTIAASMLVLGSVAMFTAGCWSALPIIRP